MLAPPSVWVTSPVLAARDLSIHLTHRLQGLALLDRERAVEPFPFYRGVDYLFDG